MNRSGYVEDGDGDELASGRWRAQVASAMRGRRGQSFLKELAAAMDAMPVKELIANELINEDGQCCAIGVVCKARGLDVSEIDYEEPKQVGGLVGIAHQMAAEIEWYNDDYFSSWTQDENGKWISKPETPSDRWTRMRKFVDSEIKKPASK